MHTKEGWVPVEGWQPCEPLPTTNVFCPTGKGGGVDPTCGRAGKEPSKEGTGEKGDISEAHFLGTRNIVNETKESWKYKEEVQTINERGREFEVGGRNWREAGNCVLNTGLVRIYSPELTSVDAIRRITAHELMHGSFEKVYKKYDEERSTIANHPDPTDKIRMSGELRKEHLQEFPTYGRFWKFREDTPIQKFIDDDGVSDYSKAYWKDYAKGKVTFHIAVHETLAEIAGHHEETGIIIGSKLFKDYYKAIRDEYKVLSGAQKTRKGVGIVKNESLFADHNLYLDKDFQPTTAKKAIYLRWWKSDGENGFAVTSTASAWKQLEKLPTNNVFCPTGSGGGVDPTCGKNATAVAKNLGVSNLVVKAMESIINMAGQTIIPGLPLGASIASSAFGLSGHLVVAAKRGLNWIKQQGKSKSQMATNASRYPLDLEDEIVKTRIKKTLTLYTADENKTKLMALFIAEAGSRTGDINKVIALAEGAMKEAEKEIEGN